MPAFGTLIAPQTRSSVIQLRASSSGDPRRHGHRSRRATARSGNKGVGQVAHTMALEDWWPSPTTRSPRCRSRSGPSSTEPTLACGAPAKAQHQRDSQHDEQGHSHFHDRERRCVRRHPRWDLKAWIERPTRGRHPAPTRPAQRTCSGPGSPRWTTSTTLRPRTSSPRPQSGTAANTLSTPCSTTRPSATFTATCSETSRPCAGHSLPPSRANIGVDPSRYRWRSGTSSKTPKALVREGLSDGH